MYLASTEARRRDRQADARAARAPGVGAVGVL